jgi:hypothetical protein
MRIVLGFTVVVLVVGSTVHAQSSASYKLQEQTINAGGNPASGSVLESASYRVRLDSIGDGVASPGLSSASYEHDAGFVMSYAPPGEVQELRLGPDKVTLVWTPERSVGSYNVYRDLVSALGELDYGVCLVQEISGETTSDTGIPSSGSGYFYLLTAENRLEEEGTKGFASSGAARLGTTCP